jgi:hypothetical protein
MGHLTSINTPLRDYLSLKQNSQLGGVNLSFYKKVNSTIYNSKFLSVLKFIILHLISSTIRHFYSLYFLQYVTSATLFSMYVQHVFLQHVFLQTTWFLHTTWFSTSKRSTASWSPCLPLSKKSKP